MNEAIFLNGVFEGVLTEIIEAQQSRPGEIHYLQPHASSAVAKLRDAPPTDTNPVDLYISTTRSYGLVRYRATIVGWENKQELTDERLAELNDAIKSYQPGEEEIYLETNERRHVNLIWVRDLLTLSAPIPVHHFRKTSDGTPLKPRTTAGGWSYVTLDPAWDPSVEIIRREALDGELERGVQSSTADRQALRKARLAKAHRLPQRVQVISTAYRRNPDVIVEVLRRAKGFCERCHKEAPFLRAKDGSPYLEVHHTQALANGGEDVLENAEALCPNCHREAHYGKANP